MYSARRDFVGAAPVETAKASYSEMGIAVVLPCYNEEAAIADVVAGFRKVLSQANLRLR